MCSVFRKFFSNLQNFFLLFKTASFFSASISSLIQNRVAGARFPYAGFLYTGFGPHVPETVVQEFIFSSLFRLPEPYTKFRAFSFFKLDASPYLVYKGVHKLKAE